MFSAGVQHGEQFGLSENLKERYQENGDRVLCDTYNRGAVTHVLAVL